MLLSSCISTITIAVMQKIILAVMLFSCVYAKTDEEVKADFIKLLMQCTSEHPVEMTELTQLQKLIVPKNQETKCLLACAYKKEGIMNSKGMYDLNYAYKMAELNKNGDDKRLENGKKFADICVKVNDIEVSDGEKGCDRAAHMFKCLLDNAPKINSKGMYDLDHAYKMAELNKNGDEKRLENGKNVVEPNLNDIEVSDGEKGCDRAVHMFKCLLDNAPKLGFNV